MTTEQHPDHARNQSVLDVFLAFREADMDLWRRAGNALDLTTNGMLALAVILRSHSRGAPARQVDVRTALQLSAAGASSIVDALVKAGLVRREPLESDRRAVLLVPAYAGGPVEEEVARADRVFMDLLAAESPESIAAFARILGGMTDYVRSQFPPGRTGA
jgi:DNA-binding MarR family transcriptional regulator